MSCCGTRNFRSLFASQNFDRCHSFLLASSAAGSARKRPHFDTSPYWQLLYYSSAACKNQGLRPFLLGKLLDLVHLLQNLGVISPSVGNQAVRAVLNAVFRISKVAAAVLPQGIQGTVTEQTAKICRILSLMAWKVFTIPVLEEIIATHRLNHLKKI